MANLRKWSSSASGNATITGGINTISFAEGQSAGSVNNSAREMMAQMRSIYKPEEWGWVEHSATVSVTSQTVFKLAGNQISNFTAARRFRIKSGSTTRYGAIVSSSFTAETTITVTVDSGSLSASHSLVALAAIDSNHVPAISSAYITSASVATALGTYVTSSSLGTALATYVTSSSLTTAIANYITSNSASVMISARLTIGTMQTPTAVAVADFTGIPSTARRITINFRGLSTNGTSNLLVQLGDSGGVETTGYISTVAEIPGGSALDSTAGFIVSIATSAAHIHSGIVVLSLVDAATFTWVATGALKATTALLRVSAGDKALSAALDRFRVTTVGGLDTFDAGSINYLAE